MLWAKRDKSTGFALLRDRQNLHEVPEREAQLAVLCELNSQKNWLRLNPIWRLESGRKEIQNFRCKSRDVSWNLKDNNYDEQDNGQIKLREK